MTRPVTRLLFIYNADSGLWDAIVDGTRKLLRINGCTLCEITHGLVGEKSEWRACHQALGVPIDYLHRDELSPDLQSVVGDNLPSVLAEVDGELEILLEKDGIARCKGSVEDLRGKLLFHAARHNLSII